MRYKKALIGFIGMSMALFFTSQVFAKPASIEGWDKAKLGMSIEGLKESYRQEAKFFEMRKKRKFWKDTTPLKSKLIGCTRLSTSGLKMSFGEKADVDFWFIDNKLWDIEIHIANIFSSKKVRQFIDFLTHRYGKPSCVEPDIFGNSYEWYRGNRQLMVWTYLDSKEKISSVDIFYTDGKLNELWKTRYDKLTNK